MLKFVSIAASIAVVAITSPASATPSTIKVNSHGVVISSTMRHCVNEDGSGGPKPCTWNIGTGDGDDQGLAYWIGRNNVAHYVWETSPVHGRWHWVSDSANARCVTDGTHVKCPNGPR